MRSDHLEEIIDDAVYKTVWGDHKPKYEFLASYVPGSMMADDWDALEMLKFELMALTARKTYGFDQSSQQD
tara:strand:+ start:1842 stop:2054 length:213 start_codon:yes stop_codon:yes gene_type:complete